MEKEDSNKIVSFFRVAVIIAIIAAIIYSVTHKGQTPEKNNYNYVISQLSDALEKADGKKACKAMFTPSMMEKMDDSFFSDYSKKIKLANSVIDFLSKGYITWDFTEISKEELPENYIRGIEYSYQFYFGETIKISEAYLLDVEVDWGNRTGNGNLVVINIDDCGWRVDAPAMSDWGCGFS